MLAKLTAAIGKDTSRPATGQHWFVATALALRDRIIHRWLAADRASLAQGRKRIYYLSLEVLIGRLLDDVVGNLRLTDVVRRALGDLGVDYERIRSVEPDAALGNGGLGRLAFMLYGEHGNLGLPTCGYGIRYDHGLFRQVIRDGWQQEYPEEWLSFCNPWEFARPEVCFRYPFGGRVEIAVSPAAPHSLFGTQGSGPGCCLRYAGRGLAGRHVNALRLWSARGEDPLRLDVFNLGDRLGAQASRRAPRRSRRSSTRATRHRPVASCGCGRSISLSPLRCRTSFKALSSYSSICPSPTAPRSSSTTRIRASLSPTDAYCWWTSTTCRGTCLADHGRDLLLYESDPLTEALERSPVAFFERVLPRHLEIIYRINAQHLEAADRCVRSAKSGSPRSRLSMRRTGGASKGASRLFGSHHTNGVSALHTELMRRRCLPTLTGPTPIVWST